MPLNVCLFLPQVRQQLLRSPDVLRLQHGFEREHLDILLVGVFTNFGSSGMELCAMVFSCGRTSPIHELTIDRDNWAKTVSPNKDIKIYIGAPASLLAATSGYVDADTLASCALNIRDQFSSFGGIMLWDASWAHGMSLVFIV